MRLAIIRKRFDPHGGAEKFILTAAGALTATGETVTVIAEDWKGGLQDGLSAITLPRRGLTRAGRQRNFQSAVADVLRDQRFDLVQSHERVLGADIFRAGDGVHAAWVDRLKRERGTLRGALLALDPLHRLVMQTERWMAADGRTLFVANSNLVARELSEWLDLPAERIRVIENGVDLGKFHPPSLAERAAARKSFGLPEEAQVVAFVGSGYARKGVPQLLEALALPEMNNIHAVIAGRDRTLRALRRRFPESGAGNASGKGGIGARLRLLGGIDDVRPVLAAADVFVLPSLYDPMPNAALEALATGLPVVTTANTGIAEHVSAHAAGAVASREPEAIAAAILDTLAALPARHAAAAALRQRFDLRVSTEAWRALYRELADRR